MIIGRIIRWYLAFSLVAFVLIVGPDFLGNPTVHGSFDSLSLGLFMLAVPLYWAYRLAFGKKKKKAKRG